MDTLLQKQLRQVKEELFLPKYDKLHLEDFGKLAQVFKNKNFNIRIKFFPSS
jgi:hypothetical protein